MLPEQGYMLREKERTTIINHKVGNVLHERFIKYRKMFEFEVQQVERDDIHSEFISVFETGLEKRIIESDLHEGNHQFTLRELLLFSKLKDIQKVVKENNGDVYQYADTLSEFLENSDVLIDEISENSVAEYDYLFIQALLHHLEKILNISYTRDKRNYVAEDQLKYIAQLSTILAEQYSNMSVSYGDIQLLKDEQYDLLEEISQSKNDFIYSLGELSKLTSREKYIEDFVITIKNQYLKMRAAEDGFKNLFEYMGYLMYIGSDHFLYEMGMNELENEIISKLQDLTLPDVVYLLKDDIYKFVDDSDLEFQGWEHLMRCIFSSDEFDNLVREIMDNFLRIVPEYFPD